MAKKIWIGMLALTLILGMMAGGCKGDSEDESGNGGNITSSGGLTITDIPAKYNGMYVFLQGAVEDEWFFGYNSYDPVTGIVTLSKISNGTVTAPLWVLDDDWMPTTVRFKGTGSGYVDDSGIFISEKIDYNTDFDEDPSIVWFDSYEGTITFDNGNATVSFTHMYLF